MPGRICLYVIVNKCFIERLGVFLDFDANPRFDVLLPDQRLDGRAVKVGSVPAAGVTGQWGAGIRALAPALTLAGTLLTEAVCRIATQLEATSLTQTAPSDDSWHSTL